MMPRVGVRLVRDAAILLRATAARIDGSQVRETDAQERARHIS
jgi:hypothetical protein